MIGGGEDADGDFSPLAGVTLAVPPRVQQQQANLLRTRVVESAFLVGAMTFPPVLSETWHCRFSFLWKGCALAGMYFDRKHEPTRAKLHVMWLLVAALVMTSTWLMPWSTDTVLTLSFVTVFFDHVAWLAVLVYPATTLEELGKIGPRKVSSRFRMI